MTITFIVLDQITEQQLLDKVREQICELVTARANGIYDHMIGVVRANEAQCKSNIRRRGPWVWISALSEIDGRTSDPTTDRLGGDPFEMILRRDWIGPADKPLKSAHFSDLDEWATTTKQYFLHNTDEGYYGRHEGDFVDKLNEEGQIHIFRAEPKYYHDTMPDFVELDEMLSDDDAP